jgi:O-antigen/teichoic acid export membrane protein
MTFFCSTNIHKGAVGLIVRLTLPLGFSAMLISINTAIPRYFIDAYCGNRQLGIFAALTYFIVAGNLSMNAVGQSVLPRLARLFKSRSRIQFWRLLSLLFICAAFIAASSMGVAILFGRRLLLLYGTEYVNSYPVFLIVMSTACPGYFLSVFNFSFNAIAAYRVQVPLFFAVSLCLILLCKVLIPAHGLAGAAIALFVASTIQAVISVTVLAFQTKNAWLPQRASGL